MKILLLLVISAAMILPSIGISQDTSEISVGSFKTALEKQAVKLILKHLPGINETELITATGNGGLLLKPYATVQVGEDDTFQDTSLGIKGFFMPANRTDPTKTREFYIYSAGVEAARNFDAYAGLVEFGVMPPFRPLKRYPALKWLPGDPILGRQLKMGIFGQLGRKFRARPAAGTVGSGLEDVSLEKVDDTLTRVKTTVEIDMEIGVIDEVAKMALKGSATVWYDIANKKTYRREEAVLRFTPTFTLFGQGELLKGKHIDLSYTHGSGAPTFNRGEEYGMRLTMEF